MPRSPVFFICASFASFFFACIPDFAKPSDTAQITCRDNSQCPGGWICNSTIGMCVKKIDPDPPKFDGVPVLSPLYVKKDAVVRLSFAADKDLAQVPSARLRIAGTERPFTYDDPSSGVRSYSFIYTAAGDEPEGEDYSVVVTMIDRSGNKSEDVKAGALRFDFTPPGAVPGSSLVQLISDYPENPLLGVTAVTNGTTVSLMFSVSEDLADDSPVPHVVACIQPGCDPADPAQVLALELDGSWSGGRTYKFNKKVTELAGGLPAFMSGVYMVPGPSGGVVDVAGNEQTGAVEIARFVIDTEKPAKPDTAAVHLRRVPWGVRDPISGGWIGARYSVVCDSCAFPPSARMALIYNSPATASSGLMGSAVNPGTGGDWKFGEMILNGTDRQHVYLAVTDDAGNRSDAALIKDVEWVATIGGKQAGSTVENQNILQTCGRLFPSLVPDDSLCIEPSQPQIDDLQKADPAAISRTAAIKWENRTSSGVLPNARSHYALAYDSARGRTVLYGGTDGMTLADTWEWDGSNWERKASSGPSARTNHALAYDSARGRTVLFGGHDGTGKLADTWEWDGRTWVQMASNGPPARSMHALAYDSGRGRTVLFGGFVTGGETGDTWEWDGSKWEQRVADGPPARYSHALVYDSARGRTVLFGGAGGGLLDDTWEWDGSAWAKKASGGPPGRRSHGLAYDSFRGRTVLFGGWISSKKADDLWEWDGSAWTPKASAGPSARDYIALAYDGARGRTVLFGGWDTSDRRNDTWEWDGSVWRQKVPGAPPVRHGHALAHDTARGRTVLFGGCGHEETYRCDDLKSDTWEWDGFGWTQKASGGPAGRYGHAMAYDNTRGKTVLFGGYYFTDTHHYLSDTWEWDGTAWTQKVAAAPPARLRHALAHDGVRGRTVLFGGEVATGNAGDTWEWDGSAWAPKASGGPAARSGPAMVFDGVRGRTVLFGGIGGEGHCGDTWEWDGSAWVQKASDGPAARYGHAMAFDDVRARIVLFGGTVATAPGNVSDTWEWDGSGWTQRSSGEPAVRDYSAMAFFGGNGRTVLFGGDGFSLGYLNDTWEWNGGAFDAPAQLFRASFYSSVLNASFSVKSVQAYFKAGGTGYPGGTETKGAQIKPWIEHQWAVVADPSAANTSDEKNPGPISWSTSDPATIQRMLFGPQKYISFAVTPVAANGTGTGQIALKDARVTVRYSLCVDAGDCP